ncbi:CRISPR-associated helicase/endonuclease Cas3 [Alicyclobacillus shizuokensis]|uniref:CRISPR-associated helicase/endonuclease Cas3 n=1 Tax=Alicyclobacillus shizuokensis TaxID=392014 RepID=UPI0009FB670C|nr:CRISPR-associated helicase/endonuclease Cas3 [Alicyclobacillus shizuokensis]
MRDYDSHVWCEADGRISRRTRLSDHLQAVANAAAAALADRDASLQRFGALSGLCHDFGKFTSYFQTYLVTGHVHPKGFQQHSFISALYGAFEAYRVLDTYQWLHEWDPLLIYLVIKHHHGDLANLDVDIGRQCMRAADPFEITNQLSDPLFKASHQVRDLATHMSDVAAELGRAAYGLPNLLPEGFVPHVQEFVEDGWWKTFSRLVKDARSYRRTADMKGHPVFLRLLRCFSALIDGDKRDAAHIVTSTRVDIPATIVDDYVAKRFRGVHGMATVRRGLYERVRQRARDFCENGLFTLTAPTGSGKTLSALAAAMYLRNHGQATGQGVPRVIYAMPFTSIIDQNYEVLRSVLSSLDAFSGNEHQYVMMHHHLAPVKAQRDGVELPVEDALMLQEGWDSECVVTTFVQLFDTLLGYRNRALKRLHRLANSILILDEVQSLPAEYWPLIGNLLTTAVKELRMKVILMTATQPRLLVSGAVELAGEPQEVQDLFEQLDRVDLYVDLSPVSLDQFIDDFLQRFRRDQSYLLIFNTIHTSIEVFQRLEQQLRGTVEHLSYLSGNVVPAIRRKRVEEIVAASRAGHPVLVVATQVVEAGVDLDVDVVYRELAPIDSIVQAAGRCNRNNASSDRGEVRVFQLLRESGARSSMEVVYKAFKSEATLRTLDKHLGGSGAGVIPESALPRLVTNYFETLADTISKGDSEQIWRSAANLDFSPGKEGDGLAVCDFHLITEYPSYVNLFVECDESAAELWTWYQTDVVHELDFRRRQETYLRRKAEFHGYILSVRAKRAMSLGAQPTGDGGLWYLPGVGNGHEYYHPVTGLAYHPEDIQLML